MKIIKSALLLMFVVSFSFAQIPHGINYQAIARDAGGAILASQNICIQSTITDGPGGNVLYQETFSVTTNQFGLFNLTIGYGTPVSGTFAGINWSHVNAWQTIEMEIACTGGYITMGSSQMMSVPYALSSPITNLLHSGLINSNVRNADVVSSDSTVVPETGDYLILFDISGGNSNQYLNSASYDNTGTVYLRLEPSYQISNYVNMFQLISDGNGGNLLYRYMNVQTTTTTKQHLIAGSVIKQVAKVSSVGTPTGSWAVGYSLMLIKLN